MLTNDDMIRLLSKAVLEAGSQAKWYRAHNITRQDVSDILRGHIKMSKHVADALGYKQMWVKK